MLQTLEEHTPVAGAASYRKHDSRLITGIKLYGPVLLTSWSLSR